MYIKVHVLTERKEESLAQKDDVLYLSIREKAEQGMANRKILEILHTHFGVGSKVRIVSGHHAPHKIISVG